MAEKSKLHKPIYRTDSPYTRPTIAKSPQPHHDTIVQLLVSLLSPLGEHQSHLPKSKGSWSRKRKRQATASKTVAPDAENIISDPENIVPDPQLTIPKPKVSSHVLLGFNSIHLHLEALSALSTTSNPRPSHPPARSSLHPNHRIPKTLAPLHLAAVFLLRPLSSNKEEEEILYTHLPTLCYTASLAHAELPATRLVLLDPAVESQIAQVVGLARVALLAVVEPEPDSHEDEDEVPGLKELVEYVRAHVEAVGAGWLAEAM
ncbi:hypothetical protein B0A55_05194 [Friedmanniomyces simplex]|uniref:Uncharacterized protein n=1 Tax=Friedmanniomyces simplex TaxID=329884 RepID=A0A4U0XNK6_9PEZI|nr:hypothetical protein B0A55_05194 [Friedmanniomyces simplex]